jgi:hypothetical protein
MPGAQATEAKTRERGPLNGIDIAQSQARSAVFDVLTNGTTVNVTADCVRG